MSPHAWRREVLRSHAVDASALRSADQVDAALAALTGLFALERRFSAPGDPRRARSSFPPPRSARPYRRATAPAKERQQPSLPGLAACACGDPSCTALTGREFAPGHDAKRKSACGTRPAGAGRGGRAKPAGMGRATRDAMRRERPR